MRGSESLLVLGTEACSRHSNLRNSYASFPRVSEGYAQSLATAHRDVSKAEAGRSGLKQLARPTGVFTKARNGSEKEKSQPDVDPSRVDSTRPSAFDLTVGVWWHDGSPLGAQPSL